MMVFWLVAVLLLVAALLFILPPLFRKSSDVHGGRRAALNVSIYRDQLKEMERDVDNDVLGQDQYQQGRAEIEERLLEDVGNGDAEDAQVMPGGASKITAIVLVLLIPLGAVLLYQILGTPEGLAPEEYRPPAMSAQDQSDQINQMVGRLAARLQDDPNDAEGWKMLGRSYLVLERFAVGT